MLLRIMRILMKTEITMNIEIACSCVLNSDSSQCGDY